MNKIEELIQIIGWRRDGVTPIWAVCGAEPGDDEDEDDDDDADEGDDTDDEDEDDTDDEDEEDDDANGKKPAKKAPAKKAPAKKAPEKKLGPAGESALAKERRARRTAERRLRELQQQNESDTDKVTREADEKAAAKYKPIAIRSAAKAAIASADGFKKGKNAERLARLVNADNLDVDEDGEVLGLEDEVERLRAEFPEFFESEDDEDDEDDDDDDEDETPAQKRRRLARADQRRRTTRAADGAGKKPVKKTPKTSAEKLVAAANAGRR